MTTYESAVAEIKQILNAYDQFLRIYELENWLKDVTVEEIKSSFKLTVFIEESIKHLQGKQCIDLFRSILNSWWETKHRVKIYDIEFFSTASDYLLSKIFVSSLITINIADISVRIYTTLHSKERFENVINILILKSASYKAVVNYAIDNKNCLNLKELECRFLLRNWAIEIECGRNYNVKTVIMNMLTGYKISNCLATIINVLALTGVSSREIVVQEIILTEMHVRMVDRSVLSKHLWVSLFKHVERQQLSMVCLKYTDFLKDLFDFIIYMGSMMNSKICNFQIIWINDPASCICPNLNYNDLLNLIQFFCHFNEHIRQYIEIRISQAKSSINSQLWKQLEMSIYN